MDNDPAADLGKRTRRVVLEEPAFEKSTLDPTLGKKIYQDD
jgi:hypothetical protein